MEQDQLEATWQKMAAGSLRARDDLVAEYMPLAQKIAHATRVPDHIERDDLMSWASSGLLQAVERFDLKQNLEEGSLHKHFVGYASMRIRGAILDGLKSPQFSWAPRSAWRAIKEQRAAEDVLAQTLGRAPSRAELAAHLGVAQSKLVFLQQQVPVGATNEHENHGLDLIAGSDAPEQEAGLIGLAERVALCVARLPGMVQLVLARVVVGRESLGSVARATGLTIPEVRELRAQAAVALRLELQVE